ncbi:MAG: phosphate acyltransferase PlsX [Anaeroplasmataceae bacterium]
MKIAIDAMGGDYNVETTVIGSMKAVAEFKDIELVLYGDEAKITPLLTKKERITIVHTENALDMGEKDPVKAIRNNRDASLVLALKSVKNGENEAVVSAGPTQCMIVGAHLIIKKMEQMSRVALCPIIPSSDKKGRVLLDVGANIELKAEHIEDLAVCASIVCKEVLNIKNPTVALINIGTEPGKGREVDVEAFNLLEANKFINFDGNVEPKGILTSDSNIFITDGFTGNIVLKTLEGTAKTMGKMLKQEISSSLSGKIGYLFMRKNLKRFSKRLDASEIGGAMILGIKNPVIKAHGSSDAYAFFNAIRQARSMVLNDVINKVMNVLPKKED